MRFVKGQWYSDESKTFWLYCGKEGKDSEHLFRKAGNEFRQWVPNDVRKQFTPASLTPDFSNAKVGDDCWSATNGNCIVNDIDGYGEYTEDDKVKEYHYEIQVTLQDSRSTDVFEKDGKSSFFDKHPILFNSFAQFLAYWQEEALKLKGGE